MSGLIESIRKDREAGTPGPWSAFTDDTRPHTNIVSPNPVTACVFSLSGRDKREPDVQRIARVPDMEAALLAAEELATDLSICADNIGHAAKTDPRWEGVEAKLRARLAAYREAVK